MSEWYKDGLRFECTGCGKCCTGSPGYVWIEEEEIEEISSYLNISKEHFLKTYTRQIGQRYSLLEDASNYDCIFLKDKKLCTIYKARPKQCRTYPFWPAILKSEKSWSDEATRCEGINDDAPLIQIKKNDLL